MLQLATQRTAWAPPLTSSVGTTTEQPAHSYRTLLAELATQTRNTTRLAGSTATFNKLTAPTPLQAHAHELVANAPVTT